MIYILIIRKNQTSIIFYKFIYTFIIVWPKIAPVFFDTTVVLTWTEFTRGFLFLIESKEVVMDKSFNGLIITPLDTHLMSAIVGLYFGGSLVKR